MHECFRGGLKSPRIVQEGLDEATILRLVLSVLDTNVPMPLALAWRKDNKSPLLANFVVNVQRFPDVRTVKRG